MAQPDTNVYRSAGAWGDGKGSNLTASEVDTNFWGLVERLVDLEDNPNVGVGIADFSVTGQTLTVNLTDGSTRGPFLLPVAAFKWAGDWAPSTSYDFMDLFLVDDNSANAGLYWVIQDGYTSGGTFDPNVSTTAGPTLQLLMRASMPQARIPIQNIVNADVVLGDEDAGTYFRMSSAAAHSVFVDISTSVPYVEGDSFAIRQVGNGTVTVEAMDSSIVVTPPPGFTLALRGRGASATLIYAGDDVWDASGDFAPIETT